MAEKCVPNYLLYLAAEMDPVQPSSAASYIDRSRNISREIIIILQHNEWNDQRVQQFVRRAPVNPSPGG